MSWDKFKAAQRYLQHANAIHPEEEINADLRVQALAVQDFYYDCYMSSFSREDLIKRLDAIVAGKIDLPEDQEVDEVLYRATYVEQAKNALASFDADHPG